MIRNARLVKLQDKLAKKKKEQGKETKRVQNQIWRLLKKIRKASKISKDALVESQPYPLPQNVQVVQARFEADVAIGHTAGGDDVIISNDSDLLVYERSTIVLKLFKGTWQVLSRERLLESLELSSLKLVWLASMSGNDYAPNVPDIGIKKSLAILKRSGTFEAAIDQVLIDGEVAVDQIDRYRDGFLVALAVFQDGQESPAESMEIWTERFCSFL
jgi:5'-3' exonuclease